MSQENVELVRYGFARSNEGDYDSFFDSTAPDIECFLASGALEASRTEGTRGCARGSRISSSFERFDLWLDDIRDLGDDVLALGGIKLRARGSGLDMKEPMGWVLGSWTVGGANAVLCATVGSPRSRGAAE